MNKKRKILLIAVLIFLFIPWVGINDFRGGFFGYPIRSGDAFPKQEFSIRPFYGSQYVLNKFNFVSEIEKPIHSKEADFGGTYFIYHPLSLVLLLAISLGVPMLLFKFVRKLKWQTLTQNFLIKMFSKLKIDVQGGPCKKEGLPENMSEQVSEQVEKPKKKLSKILLLIII